MSKYIVQAGWSHAPHLTEEEIKFMKESTPPHLLESRMEGKVSLGSGSIFPIPEKDIVVHDHVDIRPEWRRCYGLDVGNKCTAAVWLAYDTEADVIWVYDCYKSGPKDIEVHAANINRRNIQQPKMVIPGAIDPHAGDSSQVDGRKLLKEYRNLGLKVVPADNSVEAGITRMWTLLNSQRMKIIWNSNTAQLIKEYNKYRRNEHGKIVKIDDHAMDAWRYAVMTGLKIAKAPATFYNPHASRGISGGAKNYF